MATTSRNINFIQKVLNKFILRPLIISQLEISLPPLWNSGHNELRKRALITLPDFVPDFGETLERDYRENFEFEFLHFKGTFNLRGFTLFLIKLFSTRYANCTEVSPFVEQKPLRFTKYVLYEWWSARQLISRSQTVVCGPQTSNKNPGYQSSV